MPKQTDKDRVSQDQNQVNRSNAVYNDWEQKWSPDLCELYYYGDQIEGDSQEWSQRKYVINLFFPSIEISKPSLLFQIPKYNVTPRMNRTDDPMSDAAARAKLQEETLNTFVQDPKLGYALECGLAVLDGQFRYACVQVGYTADFIDNPNAGKPILTDDIDEATGERKPLRDKDGASIIGPDQLVEDESLYLKWIPAKTVRISERNGNRKNDCDWFAYYEWCYADDLRNNRRYNKRATSKIQATGRARAGKDPANQDSQDLHPGMVKVWFKWDFRRKQRRIWYEGAEAYLLEEPYSFFNCSVLKFNEILGQWLPLPLSYNWIHPQKQLNDMREMRRVHRDRARPKYLRRDNAFANEEEFDKLMESEEGVSAAVQGDPLTAVAPVPLSSLDNAMFRDEQVVLEDFTRVSGISGEAQQVAQSETATQANLIALMAQTRENSKRQVVALWLAEIGRLILLTIREKMALPVWIEKAIDPHSPLAPMEAMEVAKLWQQIEAEDLGNIDNDITVDLSSMSPVQQAQERSDHLAFLALLANPQMGMILLQSPYLLRHYAGMFNIHDEKLLSQLAQAIESGILAQVVGMMGGGGGKGTPGAAAPGPTPNNNDIRGQLQNQLPTEGMVQ